MVAIITRAGGYLKALAGITTSAGAADAGKVPILGANGVLDSSLVPASGGSAAILSGVTGLWWPNALGVNDSLYGDQGSYSWQGWQQLLPFWWLGGDPIKAIGINITTAASTPGTILAGMMKPTGPSAGNQTATLISDLTSANGIPTGTTGFQTATLASPLTLAPGLYWLQFVLASGSSPTVASIRYISLLTWALSGAQAATSASYKGVLLQSPGATTLASTMSAHTTGQGYLPDFQLGT